MSQYKTFTEWMVLREGLETPVAQPTPSEADRANLRSLGWKKRARERFNRLMGVSSFRELVGVRVNTKDGPGVITSSRLDTFSVQHDATGRKKVLAYSSAPYEGIQRIDAEQETGAYQNAGDSMSGPAPMTT